MKMTAVATLYKVTDPKTGRLLMIAPLATLRDVFALHDGALDRIEVETNMGTCELFFNFGRTKLGCDKIVVEKEETR